MNTTFPLPEVETHKLDNVQEQLRQQPTTVRLADFLRARPWLRLLLACSAGMVLGALLKRETK